MLNYTELERAKERQGSCCLMDARCIMHGGSPGEWLLAESSRRFSGWQSTSHCIAGWNGKSFRRQKQKRRVSWKWAHLGVVSVRCGCSTFAGAAHHLYEFITHTHTQLRRPPQFPYHLINLALETLQIHRCCWVTRAVEIAGWKWRGYLKNCNVWKYCLFIHTLKVNNQWQFNYIVK